MRLKSFQVKNFRSIGSTFEIGSDTNLTIVGPNNEGKSNLVTALVTALQLLEDHSREAGRTRIRTIGRPLSRAYDWQRDYPLKSQEKTVADTTFRLKFNLDKADQEEFFQVVGSNINENLPISIHIGRNNYPTFEVNKPGKGYASLTGKSAHIASFIGSKLSINYIPAIRTARDSAKSVEGLVSQALRRVEKTPEYVDALATIQKLQRPVLEEIEDRLKETLATFVPSVKNVELQIREGRADALRSVVIGIDDGHMTSLSSKGDGIISLVGMALLSKIDSIASPDLNMILVIEEPESHLHPRAINAIRSTLDSLARNIQVIITTHSPNLVNRSDVSANIIVEGNKARVALSIEEVRDVLGVRVSDNLTNARMNIVCEGANDCTALPRILSDISQDLAILIEEKEIFFSNLRGAGNLSYLVNSIQNAVCEPFCLLDDDQAGRSAFESARADGLLDEGDVIFTSKIGKAESEFEDMLCSEFVKEVLYQNFGVDTEVVAIPPAFKAKKFSERIRIAFQASGKVWNDNVEADVKSKLARACMERGVAAIDPACIQIFNTAVVVIKTKLGMPNVSVGERQAK